MVFIKKLKIKVCQKKAQISAILCSLSLANIAFASEASANHEPADISTLVWPTVNFAIYVFLMNFMYRKLGKPALEARTANFETAYKKADSYLEKIEREHRQAQERLRNIKREEEEIVVRMHKETEFESANIVSSAEQTSKQIADDVKRRINQESTKINEELRNLIITEAMKKAEVKLKSALTKEQDYSLRQNTIRSL